MAILYDPPSGWKYGFPKPYKPRVVKGKVEPIWRTLIRDGYPKMEGGMTIHQNARHTRFIGDVADYDEIAMLPKE